jgi:hypothetical protein
MPPGLHAPAPWFAGSVFLDHQNPWRYGKMPAPLRTDCMKLNEHNLTIGKYLISPLPKRLDNGDWAVSVSIRSGQGRGTTDRIFRLTPLFASPLAAAEYAIAEARQWIAQRHVQPALALTV